ncbi:indole-3-glycerol phosphate synthase TrpC [Neobacillus niacini]|uniref:indole-3-glycerol phosphate synthase TrpC n=1 Tax=Neobacillus niacini TaxID=86668 RepID=UPI0028612530|nr:indole-3-glycerol phosphate synthase TrpC [Neobacillus niacini]MDR6998250.1 indole-3-glycerol phosphate synthase [Neobacillus niacini]
MGTILDRIIEQKKQELPFLQKTRPNLPPFLEDRKSFIRKLEKAEEISVIAEYKRASPSKGVINQSLNPAEQAKQYERAGASAISVLTDQTFFKGSFSDLKTVREAVDLPILCKDFMIDPVQIDHATANGADIILLIVAALDENKLFHLHQYATELGLEVLVEVHNSEELQSALKLGAKLIGVNNRDLKTFNVSLEVTENLAALVKESGAFLISESGIHSAEDVERVSKAGANGILVGEALMISSDVNQSLVNFRLPLAGGVQS